MEIYRKLFEARDLIKNTKVKKEGKNNYSGYEYFTPSQISKLVHEACSKIGLIHIYSMENYKFGFTASLQIVNIDDVKERIYFNIPTSIPEIKATNAAQQLGGAVTYSERYLLMIAFDIVDNSLDFDTTENTKKTVEKQDKINHETLEIPEITAKFNYDKWDKIFLPDQKIKYGAKIFKLSDSAFEHLKTWCEYQADKMIQDEKNQDDIDFLDNMKNEGKVK
jgi:hypothetical protein